MHEGHWNDAYQFVSLHQPAAYYGVNSRELGEGGKDLVSKSQILAYYELVLKDFLATGKVIHPKYYKHLKKGAHQSHLGRQKISWFLAD